MPRRKGPAGLQPSETCWAWCDRFHVGDARCQGYGSTCCGTDAKQTAPPACGPVERIDRCRPRICSPVELVDRPRCDGAGPLRRWGGVIGAMIGRCFCTCGAETPFPTYLRWAVGRRAGVSIVGACPLRCGSVARLPAAGWGGGVFFWGRLAGRPHAKGARTKGKLFIGVYRPRCGSLGTWSTGRGWHRGE